MCFHTTDQFFLITISRVLVVVRFLQAADKYFLIAAVVMLVRRDTTMGFPLHCDGRQNQSICRHKHDNSRSYTDKPGEELSGSAVI